MAEFVSAFCINECPKEYNGNLLRCTVTAPDGYIFYSEPITLTVGEDFPATSQANDFGNTVIDFVPYKSISTGTTIAAGTYAPTERDNQRIVEFVVPGTQAQGAPVKVVEELAIPEDNIEITSDTCYETHTIYEMGDVIDLNQTLYLIRNIDNQGLSTTVHLINIENEG